MQLDTSQINNKDNISIQVEYPQNSMNNYQIKGSNFGVYDPKAHTFTLKDIIFVGEPGSKINIKIQSKLIRIEDKVDLILSHDYFYHI